MYKLLTLTIIMFTTTTLMAQDADLESMDSDTTETSETTEAAEAPVEVAPTNCPTGKVEISCKDVKNAKKSFFCANEKNKLNAKSISKICMKKKKKGKKVQK